MSPRVFISATSGDLQSIRQIVKDALLTMDCHPVEQTNFPPDARTVSGMLRSRISECQALIHIVGLRYGAEPDPATLPPGNPRRSYTQMEYDTGRALQQQRGDKRFRVYTFICPDDFPYDPGAPAESDDKVELQRQHRARLLENPHLYEKPGDIPALEKRILSFKENVLSLRATEDRRHRRTLLAAVAIFLALCGIGWGGYLIYQKQNDIAARLELDRLTDRVLAAYQERFRQHREQSKDLPNAVIDKMVRAELPAHLKADAAAITTILDTEAPRLAAAADTPLDRKLAALFVMGEYQSVVDTGEKRLVESGIPALRTMGDAARAIFDKTPDKKHLENALRYYQGAAALTDQEKEPLAWADNQLWAARLLHDLARHDEAEPLLRAGLEIRQRELGPKDSKVATTLNNLAMLLRDTSRRKEAEVLMREALAIDEANLDAFHPTIAIRLNNLAALLRDSNRLTEAEPLMRRALTIWKANPGPSHPSVAIGASNLAELLRLSDRLAEAEPLLRQALLIFEATYGGQHPKIAKILNNLSAVLRASNRPDEAEALLRRALSIVEASSGKDHPNVANYLSNLAVVLQKRQQYSEAELLIRRALTIIEAKFGPSDAKVATILNNLATLLVSTDRHAEAEPLMRRALAIDEGSFGKDHPDVARDLNNLATLLQATNRLAEAEPLMKDALRIMVDSLSKEHPNSVQLRKNLEILQKELRTNENP